MNTVLIVAGETSGDIHGAQLVREMKTLRPNLIFFGLGGDELSAQGVEILTHIRHLSFMGFIEVLKHLPRIKKVMEGLVSEVLKRKPALTILIDYPGFNLRLAERLKSLPEGTRTKIFYYISPQVWAWGAHRIPRIARAVDRMAGILPFEAETYRGSGLDFHFVGHPLLDEMQEFCDKGDFFHKYQLNPDLPLIALLPGSREQEVKRHLPAMLAMVHILKRKISAQFALGVVDSLTDALYPRSEFCKIIRNDTHNLLHHANLVITASGTATLETVIAGTPMIVVYKMNPLTYQLGRRMVKIDYISLVNVVAGKKIVPELLQSSASPKNIAQQALELLENPSLQQQQREGLARVKASLGTPGASRRAAQLALELMT